MGGVSIGKRGSRLRSSATDKTLEWPERGVTRLAKVPALPHDDDPFPETLEPAKHGESSLRGPHPPRCLIDTARGGRTMSFQQHVIHEIGMYVRTDLTFPLMLHLYL
jgi:hypothetical protein